MRSLRNAVILALGTMVIVLVVGALAVLRAVPGAHPGPRRAAVRAAAAVLDRHRDGGDGADLPADDELNLIDTQLGVVLVMTGGLLPAAIFILKDFMDATPRSYEESARVFGATPLQILRDVVHPDRPARPGDDRGLDDGEACGATSWSRSSCCATRKYPAAVVMYTFYTEGGQAEPRR